MRNVGPSRRQDVTPRREEAVVGTDGHGTADPSGAVAVVTVSRSLGGGAVIDLHDRVNALRAVKTSSGAQGGLPSADKSESRA